MVMRQVKESLWPQVYGQITTYGKTVPLSLQYDMGMKCNGTEYIIRVQPVNRRRIIVLQAVRKYEDGNICEMVEDDLILSALLELIIYQGGACNQ